LLESLANLESTCRDAVDCLNVLAYRSAGPEFGQLRRLRELYGDDGKGGHNEEIRRLAGVVGHCLNAEVDVQNYRFDILMDQSTDEHGNVTVLDEPYIDGSEPHVIQARNAVDTLLKLLDSSKESLNSAIASLTGGGLIERFNMTNDGLALVDNAWQRLGDNWDLVMKRLGVPKGLDLSGLSDTITTEIEAAKHVLTFGPPLPTPNEVKPETKDSQPGPKRKTSKKKRTTDGDKADTSQKCVAGLVLHHRYDRDEELNLEPVKVNAFASTVGVSPAMVSTFFQKKFGGHAKYRMVCKNAVTLENSLKLLCGDFTPSILFKNLGTRGDKVAADEPGELDE
jgi:hypothetical protein